MPSDSNFSKMSERLQAFLAHAGVASRRASERLITEGRVTVNGLVVTELGAKAAPGDAVCVDGVPVKREAALHYFALNKPSGYICASSDPHGRPLALTLLPIGIKERLYNIGRLDLESSGLILFTNDGDFAAKVAHPRASIEKEYLVTTSRSIPDALAERFLQGIAIETEAAPPSKTAEGIAQTVFRAKSVERAAKNVLSIVLIEGKNREIRRVFSHFHLHITSLRRVRIGPVLLGDLPEGASRRLTQDEIERLRKTC
jgi:23S rRNA pseudouridine2605 synthase